MQQKFKPGDLVTVNSSGFDEKVQNIALLHTSLEVKTMPIRAAAIVLSVQPEICLVQVIGNGFDGWAHECMFKLVMN